MDKKKFHRSDFSNQIAVVVGTRPGIIKMSPLVKELSRRGHPHILIHAGQHYSYNLDNTFFKDLDLPVPDYRVDNIEETQYHGEQTAEMLAGIEQVLLKERPTVVLVCGDANYNLAGALAARKLGMIVGHVEAGLRSDDWRMPEEHNRVIIDHISEHLFAPTKQAEQNARADNVKGEIHVTGNTIVDAVNEHRDIAEAKSDILTQFSIEAHEYFLTTAHREENVDDVEILSRIVTVFERLSRTYQHDVVFSMHPRTEKMLKRFDLMDRLESIHRLHVIEPVGYLDFLNLESNARAIITDSGGIQEEACILQVPCVTLRENTERPETIEVGSNIVAGTDPEAVLDAVARMLDSDTEWENPFGDGTAAEYIIDTAMSHIQS